MNSSIACEDPNLLGVGNDSLVCDSNGGTYSCDVGYTGDLCDQCANGFYNNSGFCEGKKVHAFIKTCNYMISKYVA